MTNNTTNTSMKRCTRCKIEKPRTNEYFAINKTYSDGLSGWCKTCHYEYLKEYRKSSAGKATEQRWLKSEKYRNLNLRYREKRREHARANRLTPSIRKRNSEYHRTYRKTTHGQMVINRARTKYTSRKELLPNSFTESDWKRALTYFNGRCAVCGRQLQDLFGVHEPSVDHWIPLSDKRPDNPGTVPWNILPLCHGEGGCNNRKHDSDPDEWLARQFGKRAAKKIADRIKIYFDMVKRLLTDK